jgi:hypothetical protein
VTWEISPEPRDDDERTALLQAADRALGDAEASVWWRSGLEDLGGGATAEQAWSGAGAVEP